LRKGLRDISSESLGVGLIGVPHWDVASASGLLFPADVPPGFHHREDFVTADEESALVAEILRIEFADFEMRGVVARRRVAFFGLSYDAGRAETPPLPDFLLPLRDRVAEWAGLKADAFAMALINEYRPGAPIGWHRDAPQYAIVAGISLLSACRMRFRPYVSPTAATRAKAAGGARRTPTHEILLNPRSAYLMTGESRSAFEHHIPAVITLRYSVTFRTLR
jgi:alkylated DNA repair dioxygenase AlkB